jgi:methylisocitrate lyase
MGTINAYCALLAQRVGYRAIYLSGAGVANASYGLPDLGITNLGDVSAEVQKITGVTDLPLIVDVDTGWGDSFGIARTVGEMVRSGAAGIHIEDQIAQKRCGHRPNKEIVACGEMVDRIKSAVDARTDDQFVIIARTDGIQREGLSATIDRAAAYVEAGADCIFPEAVRSIDDYRRLSSALPRIPVLANITEFGETPLLSVTELASAGVGIVLYPLSAFRAMAKAALHVYETVRRDGHQRSLLKEMQTRTELYDVLGYDAYEKRLDELFGRNGDTRESGLRAVRGPDESGSQRPEHDPTD